MPLVAHENCAAQDYKSDPPAPRVCQILPLSRQIWCFLTVLWHEFTRSYRSAHTFDPFWPLCATSLADLNVLLTPYFDSFLPSCALVFNQLSYCFTEFRHDFGRRRPPCAGSAEKWEIRNRKKKDWNPERYSIATGIRTRATWIGWTVVGGAMICVTHSSSISNHHVDGPRRRVHGMEAGQCTRRRHPKLKTKAQDGKKESK